MQTNAAEVVRAHDLTHDVRELDLRLISPATLDFQPGQFISFEIPVEGRPHPMTRAYSIASPPSQRNILTLVFNRVDHGPGRHCSLVSNPAIRSISKGRREVFVYETMRHAISCLSRPARDCSDPVYAPCPVT